MLLWEWPDSNNQSCLLNPFTPKFEKYTPRTFQRDMYKWARLGSIIIFRLSKLWKAKFLILCDVIFLVRLYRGNLKLITFGSICLSILSIYLSNQPPIHPSIPTNHPTIHPSVFPCAVCLSIYLSIHPSVRPSAWLPVCLSVCRAAHPDRTLLTPSTRLPTLFFSMVDQTFLKSSLSLVLKKLSINEPSSVP